MKKKLQEIGTNFFAKYFV